MSQEPDSREKPLRSRLNKVLYIALISVIIGGMLGTTGAIMVWLNARKSEPQPEQLAAPTLTVPPPTSTPNKALADEVPAHSSPVAEGDVINRIAYISPDGQVATIGPDGSNGRFLSGEDLAFRFPAWSPNGQYLAAIGGSDSGIGVYLLTDANSSDQTQELYFSTSETPIYLYWSPDSRLLSFLASHPTDVLGMHLASVDPGEDDRILVTGSPMYWDWMAESDQIMVHIGFAGDNARLALIDPSGDGQEANIASPGFFQAPDVSANGRFLAYAEAVSEGKSQVTVADTETGTHQQETHAGLVAMSWSPVEDKLAMISASEESTSFFGPLRLLDAVSGELRLLSRETVLAFFWSPDGRYIAAVHVQGGNDDLNAGVPFGPGKKDSTLAKFGRQPDALSGKPLPVQQPSPVLFQLSIIEVASGQKRNLAAFQPTRMFLSQFLPFFDQYALSHRVWSPDSEAVVFPMRIDGEDRVVVLPVNGGGPQQIADGDMPFWSHQ